MAPGTVSVPHGWWIPEAEGKGPSYFKAWENQINLIIPNDTQASSGYGGGAYKTTLCRLRKIEPGEGPMTPPAYADNADFQEGYK